MSDNKVVRWGFSAEIYPLGNYVTYHDYMMLKEDNDRLRAELANLQASDIHTCWAECQRPMCVMRRERDRAVAELDEANRRLADVVHAYEGQAAELAEAKALLVPDVLRECLVAWWQSHRPVDWCEEKHLNSPAVNCTSKVDASLARSVADMLAAAKKQGGADER